MNGQHHTKSVKENDKNGFLSPLRAALAQAIQESTERRLSHLVLKPERIVDLNGNTVPDWLKQRYPEAVADVAENADLLWSAFSPENVFVPMEQARLVEAWRRLDEEGVFFFVTLGQESLSNFKKTLADKRTLEKFPSMVAIGNDLVQIGFTQPVLDREIIIFSYPDKHAAHDDLHQERWLISDDSLLVSVIASHTTQEGVAIPFEIIFGLALRASSTSVPEESISQPIRWYY
ncbi:MAG: hypothetical protein LBS40_06770 [Burkholderiales bacterium]|jgi:hypothetical protein|nr:hypothetical protein [Burkholderiales bacterium]